MPSCGKLAINGKCWYKGLFCRTLGIDLTLVWLDIGGINLKGMYPRGKLYKGYMVTPEVAATLVLSGIVLFSVFSLMGANTVSVVQVLLFFTSFAPSLEDEDDAYDILDTTVPLRNCIYVMRLW